MRIAFDPFQAFSEDPEAEIFAVQDSSHLRSKRWIPDIAEIFKNNFSTFSFIMQYCADNPEMTPEQLDKVLTKLRAIGNRLIGVIDLSDQLDIDVVTDIFIRINSKGTALSQGDFVMSKIAADEQYGGNMLRKAIDYFAHMAVVPSFASFIKKEDAAFTATEYWDKISWLAVEQEDVYDPDYDDILRVAFMHKFPRAKLSDLVSLLSGRDFETKEFREDIIADTYARLKEGVLNVFNEHNFKQFVATLRGAGFISSKLVSSQMALDFAYTLYLILSQTKEVSSGEVKRLVQRWYVLSVLTGRYSSSPETAFTRDIRLIAENGVVATLQSIEAATLSDTFWDVAVPQNLCYTSTNNPTYLVYLAAQVVANDVSLLSNNLKVRDLIETIADVHHVYPKAYLKGLGYEKSKYNQEANYAYLDAQVNKSIGKKAPTEYFGEALAQCETGVITCGSITDKDVLMENLRMNCIPEEIFEMDETRYEEFLEKRRKLMAEKIRKYYEAL